MENATLRLGYNIQPWVGALLWDRTASLGRWQGLESEGAQWRFSERKLSAKEVQRKNEQEVAAAAAAEGGVKKQGGKVEEGMAKPVVGI